MKRRLFAILMAVMMVLALVPMTGNVYAKDADITPPVIDVSSLSIDKTTATAGETVTVSVTVTDDTEVSSVYCSYYNSETEKYMYKGAVYNATTEKWEMALSITDNTPSGLWKIRYVEAYDTNENNSMLWDKREESSGIDLSAFDFEVTGTEPDLTPPIIDVSSLSVDKTTATSGETVTLSVTVTDDTEVNSVDCSYYNAEAEKYMYKGAVYNATTEKWEMALSITDNTPSGLWIIRYVEAYDTNENGYLIYDKREESSGIDLSAVDFEVTGTEADITPPDIDVSSLSVDKTTAIVGETVTLSVAVTDDTEVNSVNCSYYNAEVDKYMYKGAVYNATTEKWEMELSITDNTPSGLWRIRYVEAYDTNDNGFLIFDKREDSSGIDLSVADFTVSENCEVKFETNGGTDVATQYVVPGGKATKPDDPTKEGYHFGGWYSDEALTKYFTFSMAVNEDITLYAKWNTLLGVNSYDATNEKESAGGMFSITNPYMEGEPSYGWEFMILDSGDSIKLEAFNDKGNKFVGWYEGKLVDIYKEGELYSYTVLPKNLEDPDTLISTDVEYTINVEKETMICAVFEKCTEHDFGEDIIQKATPDKNGRIYHVCKICGEDETIAPLLKVSNISLEKTEYTYTGEAFEPKVTVANASEELAPDNYTVKYSKNVNAGTANVKVTLQGEYYEGSKTLTFKINRADQTITSKNVSLKVGKTAVIKAKTSGDGKLSYKVKSGDAVTVDKNGKITALKKGTSVITITASKTANYNLATKDIKVTVTEDPVKTIDMLRLYNPNSGEHFYTASAAEKDTLVAAGWQYEGLAWKAPEKSKTPVYRVYNANAGDHHYTISKSERDTLVAAGWKDEGIGWYSDDAKTVAIYRVYNPNATAGSHHFTYSKTEVTDLVKVGWKDEGTAWFGR